MWGESSRKGWKIFSGGKHNSWYRQNRRIPEVLGTSYASLLRKIGGALSRSLGTLWEATSCCWSAGKSREENRRRTGAFPAEIDDVREEQTTASSTTTTTFDRVSSSPSSSSLEGVPQPPTTTTPLPNFSTYCQRVCVRVAAREENLPPPHTLGGTEKR